MNAQQSFMVDLLCFEKDWHLFLSSTDEEQRGNFLIAGSSYIRAMSFAKEAPAAEYAEVNDIRTLYTYHARRRIGSQHAAPFDTTAVNELGKAWFVLCSVT
jgi:hypothetical protein